MQEAARQLVLTLATKGKGAQVFLGARWIPLVLGATPRRWRFAMALRVLSWSPHYFYPDAAGEGGARSRMALLHDEFIRCRRSRACIADRVVAPHLDGDQAVLDLGCGPGFLSVALAAHAGRVIACDVSDGALACAKELNAAPNVEYVLVEPGRPLPLPDESVDVVCSFAVLQHVPDVHLGDLLAECRRVLRPGGTALMHVPVDKEDWSPESQWRADTSVRGRLKLKYGLNCFGRSRGDVTTAMQAAGLQVREMVALGTLGALEDDDLEQQELFVSSKPASVGRVTPGAAAPVVAVSPRR